jgi:uncharacterized membrane protein YcjF (UPF0283 family)
MGVYEYIYIDLKGIVTIPYILMHYSIVHENVDWIYQVQDRAQWLAFVNVVMKYLGP